MIPNLSLSDGVVEIVGDNGAHYLAYVVDVIDPNDPYVMTDKSAVNNSSDLPLITLRFKNDWRRRDSYPLNRIRLPPNRKISLNKSAISSKTATNESRSLSQLTEECEAEVWRAKKEGHECGFWKCIIKMVKDNFYGVLYGFDDDIQCKIDGKEFTEVVTKERIRPINTNSYLTSNPFFKFVVEVPKDLIELYPNMIKRREIHKNFKNALSLIAVEYNESRHRLICIGFANLQNKPNAYYMALKGASLLAETHFKAIKTLIEFKNQIEVFGQQFKHLDEIIKIKENEYEIVVRVEENLMRYAIGTNGFNIKKVLKLPGILSVDRVPGVEGNIFRVVATNRNALRMAKEMLQIMERVVSVPRDIVAHIIGKGGSLIQEMTDKSGLIIIKVKNDDQKQSSIPFHLIGSHEAIQNADLLLTFQMNCVKENMEFDKKVCPKRVDSKRRFK